MGKIPARAQNESWSHGNCFYISLWVVIKDQEVMLTEKIKSILCAKEAAASIWDIKVQFCHSR